MVVLIVVWSVFLGVVVHDEDLAARVLLDELLHRHLNEHVVVDFVRAATFEFSGDSAVDCRLLHLLMTHFDSFGLLRTVVLDGVGALLVLVLKL